jgi:TetR/AcrR family transcriptional regulator, transcriptional repressor for nem operon
MSSDTRQRIALAAMQLFWEKGYGSTSIADVLQAANVNSGSLYHFFPGKQELLLAVLEMYRGGIAPMLLAPAWKGVDDPVERVFALLARYRASLVATDCAYGCPIGSIALELHEPDPPVRALLAANFQAWSTAIASCLEQAGTRLPPGTDRSALSQFVLSTMEGAVMQARTYRDIQYFDGSVAQLRNYFDMLQRSAGKPALKTAKGRAATRPIPTRRSP